MRTSPDAVHHRWVTVAVLYFPLTVRGTARIIDTLKREHSDVQLYVATSYEATDRVEVGYYTDEPKA